MFTERKTFDFAERNPQSYEKQQIQLGDTANTRLLLNDLHPNRGKIIELGSSCGLQPDVIPHFCEIDVIVAHSV